MTLFIVITVFLLLIVFLLLAPITICIDSMSNQYFIELKSLIKANLEKHEAEFFRIRMKIVFMNFYIYPFKTRRLKKQKRGKEKQVMKAKRHSSSIRIFKILRTFKIKQFYINIDTGNCILNAKLYPLFALLNYNTGNFYINFQGQNQLVLIMKNRPINIIKSFINF